MKDFCWLSGPELCGHLNFDLPLFEILATTIVSGLVVWASVYFSAKAAQKETTRTLQAEQMRQLQAAIVEFGRNVELRYNDEHPPDFRSPDVTALNVDALIRMSGLPNASLMADWALHYSSYAESVNRLKRIDVSNNDIFTEFDLIHPSMKVTDSLIGWMYAPTKVNVELREQNIKFYKKERHRINIQILKTMQQLEADAKATNYSHPGDSASLRRVQVLRRMKRVGQKAGEPGHR